MLEQETTESPLALTDAEWREFQSIPEQGFSHRAWIDAKIAARAEQATDLAGLLPVKRAPSWLASVIEHDREVYAGRQEGSYLRPVDQADFIVAQVEQWIRADERASTVAELGSRLIPSVPHGPLGVPADAADADYFRSAARNIRAQAQRGNAFSGSNVTETVAKLCDAAAAALDAGPDVVVGRIPDRLEPDKLEAALTDVLESRPAPERAQLVSVIGAAVLRIDAELRAAGNPEWVERLSLAERAQMSANDLWNRGEEVLTIWSDGATFTHLDIKKLAWAYCDYRSGAKEFSVEQVNAAAAALRARFNVCGDDIGCQCEDAARESLRIAVTALSATNVEQVSPSRGAEGTSNG